MKFHGYDPKDAIVEIKRREGEANIRLEDVLTKIDEVGNELALVLIGGVNYYTGQVFDMETITEAGHKYGAYVGWDLAVEGHFYADKPWWDYQERFAAPLSEIVGAKPTEVGVMNTLTVNLHLLMVSFYNPTPKKYKIICEEKAFPSDQYIDRKSVV